MDIFEMISEGRAIIMSSGALAANNEAHMDSPSCPLVQASTTLTGSNQIKSISNIYISPADINRHKVCYIVGKAVNWLWFG
jgi:hypothetical protein